MKLNSKIKAKFDSMCKFFCANKKKKSLWHFCSYYTFVKIFQTGNIWLSDIIKSNDELELALCKSIENRINEKFNAIINNEGIDKAKNKLEYFILPNESAEARSPNLVWIFCMTTNSKALWQWVEYADKLDGIAIEFDYDKLNDNIVELNNINDSVSFGLCEIEYMDSPPEKEIDIMVNQLIESYKLKVSRQEITNQLLYFSSNKKVNIFKNENEVRLIAINSISDKIKYKLNTEYLGYENPRAIGNHILYDKYAQTYEVKGVSTNLKFKCIPRDNDIVSHIECPLKLKEIIKTVRFCQGHQSKREIRRILDYCLPNNNIKIEPFYLPYARNKKHNS